MVLVLALGGCVAMGALACAAADETGESATEASESSATATAGDGCEGGPSCGSNEQCGHASTVCSCDAAFEYCSTSESPGGCVETPAACSDLSAAALEQCLSDQWCDGAPGSFVEGAFECIAIDECHGDCDLNPEGCMDTGPGPVTCGAAQCEGSDVCVKPGDDCQCDDAYEYCDYVDQPEACQAIPNDCVGLVGSEFTECLNTALCPAEFGGNVQGDVIVCPTLAEDCNGDCDLNPDSCGGGSDSSSTAGGGSTGG